MFKNIGGKVKMVARVICWVGIAASVIGGIALMSIGHSANIAVGLVTIIVGSLLSWIGSLTTYAVGESAENSTIAAELLAKADAERNSDK